MFVFSLDGSRVAKIDLNALAHDGFAIKNLADPDSGVFVKEGDDYAAEGAEGCPGMDWR